MAWGNHKSYALNNGSFVDISLETSYTQDGLNNKLITELNPFRYRGYYFDTETNLYYLNSRYYDPEIGRFINADDTSILSESMSLINGLNLYSYCNNNPINYFDPSGTFLISLIVGFLVATTIIGGVVGGVTAYQNGSKGWDLFKNVLIGSALGLASGGAIIATTAVFIGALGIGSILGVGIGQIFAIGALAFDFVAFFIAPIFDINMPGIEYEGAKEYPKYTPPKYFYPSNINNNFNIKQEILNDKILWFYFRR